MASGGADKTEKATPKRREEARKEGQVARSVDLNGAVVLLASIMALGALGPALIGHVELAMRESLGMIATADSLSNRDLGSALMIGARETALAIGPLMAICAVAALLASVAQVGWKPSAKAIKPDPKRINPLQGAKKIFGPQGLFEGGKAIVKVAVVGGSAALALVPEISQLGALVGMAPSQLAARMADTITDIALRAGAAYLVLAAADYAFQRWRHEKQLRMDHHEVKEELKQQQVPSEVRAAQRRRAMHASRARMMAAVPEADVVVTNPTHYAVALRYDGSKPSPEVVAKGRELIALRIRELAKENGVPVIENPPLARGLESAVKIGDQIPAEFFQAVAELLAFVYRTAGRRKALAS